MGSQPLPTYRSPFAPPGVPPDPRKLIHFATDGVPPPTQVYVDANDALFTEIWSTDVSPIVIMRYRILNPAGEIIQGQEQFAYTVASRISQQFQVQLTEGFLLSLELQMDANQPSNRSRGQTRARVFILRGTKFGLFLSQVLIQGMIDAKSYLTWPNGLIEVTAGGQGFIRSVTGTTPGAGAEVNETVPQFTRWGFRTLRVVLATSAAVANRAVKLAVTDGANTLFVIESGFTQVASTTFAYNFGLIGARALANLALEHAIPFPQITMLQGYKIVTSTVGLQAGDQYSQLQYSVEDWFDTP